MWEASYTKSLTGIRPSINTKSNSEPFVENRVDVVHPLNGQSGPPHGGPHVGVQHGRVAHGVQGVQAVAVASPDLPQDVPGLHHPPGTAAHRDSVDVYPKVRAGRHGEHWGCRRRG